MPDPNLPQVDHFRFMEENEKVMNRGGEPADGTPLLLGITKASLDRQLHLRRIVPGDHPAAEPAP